MFVCKGKVVGLNEYEKDGNKKCYYQVTFESKIKGYEGLRVASCHGTPSKFKIGDSVKVLDDFKYPQIIEE